MTFGAVSQLVGVDAPEQNLTKKILVCLDGLAQLDQIILELAARYQVLRATSEEDLLNRAAHDDFDLVVVKGSFYDRSLLDKLLVHQEPRSILFLADHDHLDSIADAIASQHEIRAFAGDKDTSGLVAYIESLLFPRCEQRHRLDEMFLEVCLPDGHSTMLPIADISNRGCAVHLRSDQTYYVPCVPGAVLASSRVVSHGAVVMDQVDATVRYVDAVEKHSELHDARLGLEFTKKGPPPETPSETEQRITDPIQAFALIKEGLKKNKKTGVLEVLDVGRRVSVMCSHVDFDSRRLRLVAVDPVQCEPGDVVRVSFELGGARYAFLSAVVAAIPSEAGHELLVRLPRSLSRTTRRAHHRLKPTLGQVAISGSSPFGTGAIQGDALDLTSSGVSFRVDGSRDLFPIGTLIDPLTLTFAGGGEFDLVGRVQSLTELPDGSWKCGVQLKDVAPATAITLADRIVDATRPKVTDGVGTDFDELWLLMKDSGFLYPEKRRLLDKEATRQTFERLLLQTNPAMKTLVSRQDGELLGHLSAIRAYSNTWEIQHLATKTTGNAMVLGRHLYLAMVEYLDQRDDSVWIRSLFQPSNRWANRIFGRYERRFTDPARKEAFIYDYVVLDNRRKYRAPEDEFGIAIRPMTEADLRTVEQLFLTTGRAISLEALDLSPGELCLESVGEIYKSLSLYRRREAIVAEAQGRIRGFAFLEFSSPSLNLSEVTNAFTPFVLDPRDYDAIQALGVAAQKRYSDHGYRSTIGLVEPNVTPALEMVGYRQIRRYVCITAHRDLYRRLHDYLAGRFR